MRHGFRRAERIRVAVATSHILFDIIHGIHCDVNAFSDRISVTQRLSGIQFKLCRSCTGPGDVITGAVLPCAFQSKRLLRGFIHQHRWCDTEVRTRVILIDSNRDRDELTGFHQRRVHGVATFFAEPAAKLWWKRAGGSHRLTADIGRTCIVERFGKQCELLTVPFFRHFHKRAIPGVAVNRSQLSRRHTPPRIGHCQRFPVASRRITHGQHRADGQNQGENAEYHEDVIHRRAFDRKECIWRES